MLILQTRLNCVVTWQNDFWRRMPRYGRETYRKASACAIQPTLDVGHERKDGRGQGRPKAQRRLCEPKRLNRDRHFGAAEAARSCHHPAPARCQSPTGLAE